MALNKELEKKIGSYPDISRTEKRVIRELLEGVDEGKQLKRIIDPLIKTI